MLLGYENFAKTATLTGVGFNTSWPVTNAATKRLYQYARGVETSGRALSVHLKNDSFSGVLEQLSVSNHNLSARGLYRLKGSNTPDAFAVPDLHLDFLSNTLDDRITFTRASTGTYWDENGVLQTATVDTPRFDHDPYTGARRGLLVEGSATNIMTYSEGTATENIDTGWATANYNVDRYLNAGTAPDGSSRAVLLVANNNDVWGHATALRRGAISSPYVGTASVYLKAGGTHRARLQFRADTTGHGGYVDVDLLAGTITATGNTNSGTHLNSWIERCPDGWFRVSVCSDMTSASNGLQFIIDLYLLDATGTVAYTASPLAESLYVWGVQMEANAYFPSSYIPTEGSAVTRSADVATISGTSLTDWFVPGAGTICARFSSISATGGTVASLDSNGSKYIAVFDGDSSGNQTRAQVGDTTTQAQLNLGAWRPGERRVAFAFAGNDFAASSDGQAAVTDTAGSLPTGETALRIGDYAGSVPFTGHLIELEWFCRRLPNAQLEAWSNRGATINSDFAACTVDLPVEYTFSRASGGTYIDSLGRVAGYAPAITAPIVPQTTLANRVKNGDFASDALWTKGTGWTIGSGVATKSAGAFAAITQTIPLVPGQVYRLRYEVTAIPSSTVQATLDGTGIEDAHSAVGVYSTTFTATATTGLLGFFAEDCSIDNVTVTLADGLRIPVGAGGDWQVGQLVRIDPQDGTSNTYMVGKVVAYDGAILTVDVSEAAAPELVSNGHFTSATTGWSAGGLASQAVVSGELEITADGTAYGASTFAVTLTTGAVYACEMEIRNGTSANGVRLLFDYGSSLFGSSFNTTTTAVRAITQQTADSTGGGIAFQFDATNSGSETGYADNVSLKRAHTDWIVSLAGPRFQHDTDGTALGLLIEPAATNLLSYSEQIDDAAWQKVRTSVLAGFSGSPSGGAMCKIIEDTSTNTHLFQVGSISASASTQYTFSIWLKAAGRGYATLNLYDGSSNIANAVADLAAGTVTASAGSAAIVSFGDWRRVSIAATTGGGASVVTPAVYLGATSSAFESYSGDGVSGLYAWGAQIETGSTATSYIPTFGVSRTRAADVCTVEGDAFDARVRQDEGAMRVAFRFNDGGVAGNRYSVTIESNGDNRHGILVVGSSNLIYADIRASSVNQATWSLLNNATNATDYAVALAYSAASSVTAIDGTDGTEDTSATMPTTTQVTLGHRSGIEWMIGTLSAFTYWPERRTDTAAFTTSGADLDLYTISGQLSDAYIADYDSGWLPAWQGTYTPANTESLIPTIDYYLEGGITYTNFLLALYEHPGPDDGTFESPVTIEIGHLGLWECWTPTYNPLYSAQETYTSNSIVQISAGLSIYGDDRPETRSFRLSWNYLSETDKKLITKVTRQKDVLEPLYYAQIPGASDAIEEHMLVHMTSLGALEQVLHKKYNLTLNLNEWKS